MTLDEEYCEQQVTVDEEYCGERVTVDDTVDNG